MNTIEKKSVRVGKYVNTEHVNSLIRNYKKERWIQNSERIGKEDSLGGWLSVEELEDFLQTAKMYGADGVSIYFGVYGQDGAKPGAEGKQTVAFVATSSEEGDDETPSHKNVYIQRNGENTLLAYNWVGPLPNPTIPPTGVGITSLGVTIAKDKNNRMVVI